MSAHCFSMVIYVCPSIVSPWSSSRPLFLHNPPCLSSVSPLSSMYLPMVSPLSSMFAYCYFIVLHVCPIVSSESSMFGNCFSMALYVCPLFLDSPSMFVQCCPTILYVCRLFLHCPLCLPSVSPLSSMTVYCFIITSLRNPKKEKPWNFSPKRGLNLDPVFRPRFYQLPGEHPLKIGHFTPCIIDIT